MYEHLTDEERVALRMRVTSSPEAWESFIEQCRLDIEEEKLPGCHEEIEQLLEQKQRIEERLEQITMIINRTYSGPISGAPYIRATMILDNISDPKIANQLLLHRMYPNEYKDPR